MALPRCARLATLAVACAAMACGRGQHPGGATGGDEARRAYLESLRIGRMGGSLEEQLAKADEAVQLAPGTPDLLAHQAGLLLSLGRAADARAAYDAAIAAGVQPTLLHGRADALCALGLYGEAMADVEEAIARAPDSLAFFRRRAFLQLARDRTVEARADAEQSRRPPGGEAELSLLQAGIHVVEGDAPRALAELDPLIARSTYADGTLPRVVRMLAHAKLGQADLVRAEFDAARLAAAAKVPALGYRYWLTPRRCSNAWIATHPVVRQALTDIPNLP